MKKRQTTTAPPTHAHDSAEWLKMERMLLFTDAVFAIIVTLLALEIRVPDTAVTNSSSAAMHTLWEMGGKFGAYALSFVVIAVLWNMHLRRYRYLVAVNGLIIAGNMIQLMLVGLIPFATSLIARSANSFVVTVYAGIIFANILVSWGTWWCGISNPALVAPSLTPAILRDNNLRSGVAAVIFGLSIPIAWWSPNLAIWSWILQMPATMVVTRIRRLVRA
jgi:uncharacterized membrane protein